MFLKKYMNVHINHLLKIYGSSCVSLLEKKKCEITSGFSSTRLWMLTSQRRDEAFIVEAHWARVLSLKHVGTNSNTTGRTGIATTFRQVPSKRSKSLPVYWKYFIYYFTSVAWCYRARVIACRRRYLNETSLHRGQVFT